MESLEEQKAIGTGDSPAMSPNKKKKRKRNRKSLEDVENVNPGSDKSGAVLESLPVGGQKHSNELEQKSVIFESNGVGNADVPKKKKNKKKKKKGNDNADNSNVLESPVNGHKQSDEPESVISEGSVGGNANVPTPSKKKNKKKNKKNVNAEKSSVLELHPLNGHEQSDKSNDHKPVSESGGGGNAAAAKKKKYRKRKKGKIANGSGDVGEKDEGENRAKRMKMDDNTSATGGQSSAVLAVPGGVVEKGEPVAGKKKRKKKNKRKKAADSLDVAEIKDAGDEPKVKRLKEDAENDDVVDSSAVSATQVSAAGESAAGKKKRKKKNKGKKPADNVEAEEIKEVGEELKVKRLKVETDSDDLVNSSVVSATQILTAGESDGPASVPCETASPVKKKKKNKRTSECVGEIQEETENVTEEQGKMEIASEKTESELKGEIEDVVEEQEGIELTSEKKGDTTVSESEKQEENEIDSEKMDNVDENEIGGDKQYDADTSQIEETNNVEKKKKKKKKKGANSEVNQDVIEEKLVLPVSLDVVAKEPEILSEKEDATGADDVEEKTPKKKKKKNKKAKESSEDVQSADAQEESKADVDGQSANEVEESKAEVDVQSASNVEESPADSKKKKRKKKGKGNDSADWTVTDIGEPSVKEAENQDGINEISKSVEPAVPIPVSLSRMYVDPPMKDEITKCWTEGSPLQKDNGFELIGQPFKCSYMPNFLQDKHFLQKVKEELSGIDLLTKNNDLYKFRQTSDLKGVSSPHIARLREFLYGDFRAWLSDVTGIELNDSVDMGSSRYGHTDVLLCHDDELEGRRVAYVLYLTPPWYEKDGGMLDLYDVDNNGQPRDVVKSLQPKWNTFTFFEVSPVSFHQVREVLSKDKVRLSINGWFHGSNIERPPKHVEAPRPLLAHVHLDEDELYSWINPSYLDADTQKDIRKKFQNDSEIELESFICDEKYQELSTALQSSQLKWAGRGPANKQSCKVLKQKKLPDVITGCSKFLQSEALFLVLSQLTGLKLHSLAPPDSDPDSDEEETKNSNPGMTLDIRQWSHGCYTLLRDSDQANKCSSLDATLFINVADKWTLEHGGFTSYIAKDEDEELLTVVPRSNCFALVYRDAETLKFTKYVNASVKALGKPGNVFYDFNCTYKE